MSVLSELFFIFVKIGLFTFGGGYAMIPLIENICVEKKKWITHDEMMNITVIAESTPGPIAINCATYVGYKRAGVMGAVIATFGVVLPSFVIIYLISVFLDNFLDIPVIANAFNGIKIAVGFLILDAAITMIKKMRKNIMMKFYIFSSFAVMLLINIFSWKISSVALMLIVATISLVSFVIKDLPKADGGMTK